MRWREVPGYYTHYGDLTDHYVADAGECKRICEEQYPDRCLSVDYVGSTGQCYINDPSSPVAPSQHGYFTYYFVECNFRMRKSKYCFGLFLRSTLLFGQLYDFSQLTAHHVILCIFCKYLLFRQRVVVLKIVASGWMSQIRRGDPRAAHCHPCVRWCSDAYQQQVISSNYWFSKKNILHFYN